MKKQHEELWAQPPIGLSAMRLTNGTGHGAQRCSRGRAGAPRSVQPRGSGAGTTSPPAAGTPALALWFWVYAFAFSAVQGPPTSAICFSVKFSCKGSQHVVLENQHVSTRDAARLNFRASSTCWFPGKAVAAREARHVHSQRAGMRHGAAGPWGPRTSSAFDADGTWGVDSLWEHAPPLGLVICHLLPGLEQEPPADLSPRPVRLPRDRPARCREATGPQPSLHCSHSPDTRNSAVTL